MGIGYVNSGNTWSWEYDQWADTYDDYDWDYDYDEEEEEDEVVVTAQIITYPSPVITLPPNFFVNFNGIIAEDFEFDFSNIEICGYPVLPDGSRADATGLNDTHQEILENLIDAINENGQNINISFSDTTGNTEVVSLSEVANVFGDVNLESTRLGLTGDAGQTIVSVTNGVTIQISDNNINGNTVSHIGVTLLHEAIHAMAALGQFDNLIDSSRFGADDPWVEQLAQQLYSALEGADNGENLNNDNGC